ncbi:MAG: hypothetical protein ACWGNV_05255, partial [Bacteroidales bacterium]
AVTGFADQRLATRQTDQYHCFQKLGILRCNLFYGPAPIRLRRKTDQNSFVQEQFYGDWLLPVS